MNLEQRKKNREINTKIIFAEIYEYEKECWRKNRFCKCEAEDLESCECPEEKKKRYVKRLNRKIENKFGDRMKKVNRGVFP